MIWCDKLILTIVWALFAVGFFAQVISDGGEGIRYLMQEFGLFFIKYMVPLWFTLRGIDFIVMGRLRG